MGLMVIDVYAYNSTTVPRVRSLQNSNRKSYLATTGVLLRLPVMTESVLASAFDGDAVFGYCVTAKTWVYCIDSNHISVKVSDRKIGARLTLSKRDVVTLSFTTVFRLNF